MNDLKELQRATGLRIFLDAPDGIEVYKPGEELPLYRAKTKPNAIAFMAGYHAGSKRGESASVAPPT